MVPESMVPESMVPESMIAMVLEAQGQPLVRREVPTPVPGPGQLRLEVLACGVCRTDLHVLDGELEGELEEPKLPLVLGHEIVGRVVDLGAGVTGFTLGQRVGVPWLGHTCGACKYCNRGAENLCDEPGFTGYTLDGGYAEYAVADADFCFPLPSNFDDVAVAPLLCAGLIGFRSYRMVGDAKRIGIWGFGGAAHILAQIAVHQGREIYAFTRPGDAEAQSFARELGAVWAGDSIETPPTVLDAAILFAPVGETVRSALARVDKGGVVVCGGIHMSEIRFEYKYLWGERQLRSVANLTREDGREFFEVIAKMKLSTETERFALADANEALTRLRDGRLRGAAVLTP